MVRKFLLSIVAAAFCISGIAQNIQVSGIVTDSEGAPIAGATVTVDGTLLGTITNADGYYTINAPRHGTLTVSSVGYGTQQIAIEERTRIDIGMQEYIEAIDDVIVVAFGTAKREAFTGSAAVIKAEDLEKRQTTNVLNALVGQVPGLQMRGSTGQPGTSGGSVNIRGIGSMYSSTSPLVIVDGAPYSASLSNIPQSDIESVTVLKDAASAALYGARGATGVIIVTTKRSTSRETVINLDMKWGVNSRALQNYDVITDPGEYYEAYYAQLYNAYYYRDGMSASAANIQANTQMLNNLRYDVYTRPSGELLIGTDGKLNPKATLGARHTDQDGNEYWLQPDDWIDEAYRNSLRQEYNLSINGGSDRSNYYMSLSYLNEDGIVYNSNYERVAARIKTDFQAKKWLKLGANVGYTNSQQNQNSGWGTAANAGNLFAYTSNVAPIYPIYVRTFDENGNVVYKTDDNGNIMYDYGTAAAGYGNLTRPYLSTGNPIGENQYNKYRVDGHQLNGTFFADFNITRYLKASISSTVTWGSSYTSQYGNMLYGTPANTGGSIEKSSNIAYRTTNLQTITYYDTFGQHNVNVLVGHEYYDNTVKYLWARGTGMFSPDIQELYATANKDNSTSYKERYNNEGYFLSGQYDYASKYYGSASFRREASSYFAPDHRWGNFWSVGAAWIISKENFMAPATWIDMLKIKASVGQQGNDAIGSYHYTGLWNLLATSSTGMGAVKTRRGNEDITWETTTNLNVGLEFSFLRGRLSGEIDFYNKQTNDLLFWLSIPESSGYRGMYSNIGKLRNTGVELNLTGVIIQTRMVDWSISANLSHNKTKILELAADKTIDFNGYHYGFSEAKNNISMWYRVGGPMYNVYIQEYAGVNEYGQALYYKDIYDDDKNVLVSRGETTTDYSDAGRYEQGTILPKVFGGFATNLRVKDFDLSLTFDYQIGGKVYDGYYASVIGSDEGTGSAGTAFHKDWVKSWSPDNTGSNMPRWQYGDGYNTSRSSRFLTKASYLNFQSFVVGYTVPQHLLKDKVKIRVYAAGENLYFWSARKGLDPRYAYVGNSSVLDYSPIRTISGGVQLTF